MSWSWHLCLGRRGNSQRSANKCMGVYARARRADEGVIGRHETYVLLLLSDSAVNYKTEGR